MQLVIFLSYSIILMILSPLLVVIFLFMWLLQFIRHGRGYYNATLLKLSTRSWILQTIAFVCLEYLLVKVSTSRFHRSGKLVKHLSVLPDWLYGVTIVVGHVGSVVPIILCIIIPYQSTFGYDGFYLRDGVLEIFDCLCLGLLESKVLEYVPALKHHNILGLHTYRWIQVCLFVYIGYNAIILITWVAMYMLQRYFPKMLGPSNNDTILEYTMGGKYLVYCANGLRKSINFILIALMLLLVWVFYFGSHLNTPEATKVLEIGTQTCVSVLVCSVLWLIKTCVLLSWEVAAVYNRLSSELVLGGNQLYFLGLITRHKHDIFSLIYESSTEEVAQDDKQTTEEHKGKSGNEDKGKTQVNSNDDVSTHGGTTIMIASLERLTKSVERLGTVLSRMKWKTLILSPTLLMLRMLDTIMRSPSDTEEKEWLKQGGKDDNDELNIKKKKKRLSKKVKERVRNDLVLQQDSNLTPTLHATQIVAQYILSARQALSDDTFTSTTYLEDKTIIKESVMKQLIDDELEESDAKQQSSDDHRKEGLKHKWEHLKSEISVCDKKKAYHFDTEHSSGQVSELSDSEIVEATACQDEETERSEKSKETELSEQIKAWMMEVWMVGIWKTTFKEVGTRTEVIYTNIELSKQTIVNYKQTGFDWNDSIELEVSSLNTIQIEKLEEKIKKHLNDHKRNFKSSHNCVKVLITGTNMNMIVSVQHNVEDLETSSTNFERVKRKQELHSKLTLKLHNLLEETK